jgi:RNA polymerase sigma-70 factor, ECF subfamily
VQAERGNFAAVRLRSQVFHAAARVGLYMVGMAERAKLGIPPLFEDAVRPHERDLMRYLLRVTRDREDSLDLFQETWLRAYRSYPALRSADGLRPWIFTIAVNLCRNRARDRMRRARVISADGKDPAGAAESLDAAAIDSTDGVLHLKAAIAKLPRQQRRALMMRKFQGCEYAEIGAALACSAESARASVYQALKKLRAANS